MMLHFKLLYRSAICPWDTKEENYRNGILVDPSSADTLPHFTMNLASGVYSERLIRESILESVKGFDDMIRRWNDSGRKRICDHILNNDNDTEHLRTRPRNHTNQFLEDFWKAAQRPDDAWVQSLKLSSKTKRCKPITIRRKGQPLRRSKKIHDAKERSDRHHSKEVDSRPEINNSDNAVVHREPKRPGEKVIMAWLD
jgi:hypothetical protein